MVRSDQQTLLLGTVFIALVLSLLGAGISWQRRTNPGFRRWAIANLLLALSLPLFGLAAIEPNWVRVVVANTLIAMASVL